MLKIIKKLLTDSSIYVACIITISIAYLSLMRPEKIYLISTFSISDKILHGIAYFTLTFFWLFAFHKKRTTKIISIIIVSCIFYGMLLEVLQGTLTNYREADYLDMIANAIGVLLGLVIYKQIIKKK